MARVRDIFGKRVISKIYGPAIPGLDTSLFSMGSFKKCCIDKESYNFEQAITYEINTINKGILEQLSANFIKRLQLCLQNQKKNFAYLLQLIWTF